VVAVTSRRLLTRRRRPLPAVDSAAVRQTAAKTVDCELNQFNCFADVTAHSNTPTFIFTRATVLGPVSASVYMSQVGVLSKGVYGMILFL